MWGLYIVLILGLSFFNAKKYIIIFHIIIQIFVSAFLIWRFNPYIKVKFNELDKKIAFDAGIIILSTSIIGNIVLLYLINIQKKIQPKELSIRDKLTEIIEYLYDKLKEIINKSYKNLNFH
jgi:hypothetical protein